MFVQENEFEVILFKNYTHPYFRISNEKFISKLQVSLRDVIRFLKEAKQLVARMSWNFKYSHLNLKEINLK